MMNKLLVICAVGVLSAGCAVFQGSHRAGRQTDNRPATHQRADRSATTRPKATRPATTSGTQHRAGAIRRANRRGMSPKTVERLMQGPRNVVGATERVAELLKSRNYTVLVDLMTTADGHNRTLTHPWNIKVSGDKLDSYLPYAGQVYLPSVSTGEGLNFDADLKGYSESTNRKGEKLIKFWVRSGEDRYDYALTVYPGGGATLRVSPDRKSAVTFDGRLDLEKR